jgi:rhomboid protease GluP
MPVTMTLLIACVAVFLLELATGATRNMAVLVYLGAIVHGLLADGEYYRLVTAMFLHGGFLHLFLNMWALYQLGMIFEAMFGSWRFLLTYFVAGIAASVVSSIFIPVGVPGVGASGAIFGILGALIVSIKRSPLWRGREWTRILTRQLSVWAGINILIGFSVPGIDNAAHIGGFVAGLILGLFPHRVPPPPPGEMVIEARPIERQPDRGDR